MTHKLWLIISSQVLLIMCHKLLLQFQKYFAMLFGNISRCRLECWFWDASRVQTCHQSTRWLIRRWVDRRWVTHLKTKTTVGNVTKTLSSDMINNRPYLIQFSKLKILISALSMTGEEIDFNSFLTFWVVTIETKMSIWIFGMFHANN